MFSVHFLNVKLKQYIYGTVHFAENSTNFVDTLNFFRGIQKSFPRTTTTTNFAVPKTASAKPRGKKTSLKCSHFLTSDFHSICDGHFMCL